MHPLSRARAHAAVFSAAFVTALGLTACGKGLNGIYSKCIPLNATTSKRSTFTVPDEVNFGYQASSFASPNCQGSPTPVTDSGGAYAVAASTVDGAKNIDFTFASGSLKGTTLYQIHKLDGSQLYLGDTSGAQDGSTDGKRPVAFEATPYARQ